LIGLQILLLPLQVLALDRCNDFIPDVRAAHARYWGYDYPWIYGLAQLRQESACRSNVTAFDAGMGVAQFMPATAKEIKKQMGQPDFDPYNPEHATKMQAFYMHKLHGQNNLPDQKLWITYMFYNSGPGTVKKEYNRVGVVDWEKMRETCKRKVLTLKNGKKLDLCDVGYDYPVRIYNYSKDYRKYNPTYSKWKFW